MRASVELTVDESFRELVSDERYPCLAATGTARRGDYRLRVYQSLGSAEASNALADDLAAFTREAQAQDGAGRLRAFVAVFTGDIPPTEEAFEQGLWSQLQQLNDRDPAKAWDQTVSADPDDPRFAFSFDGTALFVIGLHPGSSRLARRFDWPALVFNPHAQFERLRRDGLFERLRDRIRARDIALQGSLNPNLADFGARTEARQYSGRETTDAAWQCPFHQRHR
ncbi:MAG: guanitoxin biosynthesis heme-dependent pre-guanitoxin N-hydroxylase GntA [Acidobacteriota bacterium]